MDTRIKKGQRLSPATEFTKAVAIELGRSAILIEINPEYVKLIEQRCNVTMGLAL